LAYRSFLDYVAQVTSTYRECPRPTNIELHDEESFSDWVNMAQGYKSDGKFIQFVSDEEEWDAWYEYALKTIEE